MKIMVLNDGTTWSDIDGCTILEVTDNLSVEGRMPEGELIGTFQSSSGTFHVEPYKLMSVTCRRAA